MAVRVRDLEVALVLAREARSAEGQPSLRADQLRQLFGAEELDEHERSRIQAALEMAGVEPQPSLLSADLDGPVRFATATGAGPAPVFRRAPVGAGGRSAAGTAERTDFPTVAEFARSTLDRARRGHQATDGGDDPAALNDEPRRGTQSPPPPAVPPEVGYPNVGRGGAANSNGAGHSTTHETGPPGSPPQEPPTPHNAAPAVPARPSDDALPDDGREGETAAEDPGEAPASPERGGRSDVQDDRSHGDETHDWGPEPGAPVDPVGHENDRTADAPQRHDPDSAEGDDATQPVEPSPGAPHADRPTPAPATQAAPVEPSDTAGGDAERGRPIPRGVAAYQQISKASPGPGVAAEGPPAAEVAVGLLAAAAVPVVATSVAGWRFGLPFIALSVIASGILLSRSAVPGGRRPGLVRTLRSSPPSRLALKLTAVLTAIGIGVAAALAGVRTTSGSSETSNTEAVAAVGDLASVSSSAFRDVVRAERASHRVHKHKHRHRLVKQSFPPVAPVRVRRKASTATVAPPPTPAPPARTAPVTPAPSAPAVPSAPSPTPGATQGLYKAP